MIPDRVVDLERRLTQLEARAADASRRARLFGALALLGLALSGTLALAAPPSPFACTRSDFFCFVPDEPAQAAQINSNFEALYRQLDRLTVTAGVLRFDGANVTVQHANTCTSASTAGTAGSATTATSANTASSADSIGGMRLFSKPGNNGTVSCETYCASSNFGTVGTCVGGACKYVPGNVGEQGCLCYR